MLAKDGVRRLGFIIYSAIVVVRGRHAGGGSRV